jgi:hypothetical protein
MSSVSLDILFEGFSHFLITIFDDSGLVLIVEDDQRIDRYASPFGPALLVTQDPKQSFAGTLQIHL